MPGTAKITLLDELGPGPAVKLESFLRSVNASKRKDMKMQGEETSGDPPVECVKSQELNHLREHTFYGPGFRGRTGFREDLTCGLRKI